MTMRDLRVKTWGTEEGVRWFIGAECDTLGRVAQT